MARRWWYRYKLRVATRRMYKIEEAWLSVGIYPPPWGLSYHYRVAVTKVRLYRLKLHQSQK